MTWLSVVFGAACTVAAWYLPGAVLLRCLLPAALRELPALAAAPAVTAALVGVAATLFGILGVPFSLLTFGTAAVVATLVAAGIGRLTRALSRTATIPPDPGSGPVPGTRGARLALAAGLAFAAVVVTVPYLRGMGAPDTIQQTFDGVFHASALAHVRLTGEASLIGGFDALRGTTDAGYYPSVWHALTAVIPGFPAGASPADATAAANVSTLVFSALVWPLGLAALTWATLPGRRVALVAAPMMAATFANFPTLGFTLLGQWPYSSATCLLPGALALVVAAVRLAGALLHRHDGDGPGRRLRWVWGCGWTGTLAALLGVVLMHGAGAFSIVVLGGPLVVVLFFRALVRAWRAGRRAAVYRALAVVGVTAALAVVALLRFPTFWDTLAYSRDGASAYLPVLAQVVTDVPLTSVWEDDWPWPSVVVLLAVVGAVWCWSTVHARWVVAASVLATGLVLLAGGPPEAPLRVLAGPWFTQAARIMPLAIVTFVVLAAVAVQAAADALRAWWERRHRPSRALRAAAALAASVALVAGTGGARAEIREQITASAYRLGDIRWGEMVQTPGEMALIDRAGRTLPPGAVVLGDPYNGSAYLYARAGVTVVFPQLGTLSDPARDLVRLRWGQLFTDPAVCGAVTRLGVTHVYAESVPPGTEGTKENEEYSEPLQTIDTSRGYELVDQGGTAALWRLTACDDVDERGLPR